MDTPWNVSSIREMYKDGTLDVQSKSEPELRGIMDALLDQMDPDAPADSDMEIVEACLAVLDQFYEGVAVDDERVLSNILSAEEEPRKKVRRKTLILIAAVFAILFGLTITAYAAGWLQILFRWTEGQMVVNITAEGGAPNPDIPPEIVTTDYETFEQFLEENPEVPLPSYLPEGFSPSEAHRTLSSSKKDATVIYESGNGEQQIILNVTLYYGGKVGAAPHIEIDNRYSEQYTVGDTTHYIASNYSFYSVFWSSDASTYILSGNIPVDEVKRIIDSYYGG